MLKFTFLWLCLSFAATLSAQQTVTFRITGLPSYHQPANPIFLAGSFNNWNPGNKDYQLTKKGNEYQTSLQLPKGKYEYKVTRGSWENAECNAGGMIAENRVLTVVSDTTIDLEVMQWADHFPATPKRSTASKNVRIVDTAFYIPQLNRYRRIWIYLPQSYLASHKKYPVIYMQDGQNLFDEATAFSGEWGVDETLDTLGAQVGECIVVGIDNGKEKRLNEYSPYDMAQYGKGEGEEYAAFLANTLKPFIDKKYRTKKCRKHRFIAGSSMGGLISFYTMLQYPKIFGGAGIFSPSFWIVPQLKEGLEAKAKRVKGKIYFYAGMQESASMVPDMLYVLEQMDAHSKAKMTSVIRASGKHNEATWKEEFPLFYKWIMK